MSYLSLEEIRKKMKQSDKFTLVLKLMVVVFLFIGCSTTKYIPDGEQLYIGQKKLQIDRVGKGKTEQTALEEIEAALSKAPNNSFLGSSRIRTPFPFGLWFYTGFYNYEKGLGKWIFNRFGSEPILVSTVNPEVRTKIVKNLLHDYGYFNGEVSYDIYSSKKDSLKAHIGYKVKMGNAFHIDTLLYEKFTPEVFAIIKQGRGSSYIKIGDQFNVENLDDERNRISALLRNRGYYFFRPTFLTYDADTIRTPGSVSLKLKTIPRIPKQALKRYRTGDTHIKLYGKNGEYPDQSVTYKDLTISYHDKLKVRPNMLYRWTHHSPYLSRRNRKKYQKTLEEYSSLYTQFRHNRIHEKLSEVGIFKYIDLQYNLQDSLSSDTLDLTIQAQLDKPLDAELDLNITAKSNDQIGPGGSFSINKNNIFGGGETWGVKLKGSYEWQTGKTKGSEYINSYEVGLSTSLSFPRMLFPKIGKREYDFPTLTTFKLYVNQLNRAKYYRLLSFGGNATYDFQPVRTQHHTITPLRLTFNVLQYTSTLFDSISSVNPALYISLQNQFIPAMEYTFTYDNSSNRGVRHPIWWQSNIVSSGNITSLIYRAAGKQFDEKEKNLFGSPFAQFLKFSTEIRKRWTIDNNQSLAARAMGGVIWSYGNSTIAPFSEQFYVGGANSIRAYTIRSIGPGGHAPDKENRYSFVDQTGDIKLEANLEYRFRVVKDLHGAIFLDAGNVWLMREDEHRPDGKFNLKKIPKQIALGTGAGLRYDLDFLVIRLDCGIALHAPYSTNKKGFYNIEKFSDGLGIHFAIGYPF